MYPARTGMAVGGTGSWVNSTPGSARPMRLLIRSREVIFAFAGISSVSRFTGMRACTPR